MFGYTINFILHRLVRPITPTAILFSRPSPFLYISNWMLQLWFVMKTINHTYPYRRKVRQYCTSFVRCSQFNLRWNKLLTGGITKLWNHNWTCHSMSNTSWGILNNWFKMYIVVPIVYVLSRSRLFYSTLFWFTSSLEYPVIFPIALNGASRWMELLIEVIMSCEGLTYNKHLQMCQYLPGNVMRFMIQAAPDTRTLRYKKGICWVQSLSYIENHL